ncbi:MAG TPA: hypothetical protein PK358_06570 [Spirochaetota bacterium]|nr:hypothetical protein [Spirochaetota bacterium]
MGNNEKFSTNYDSKNMVLTGIVLPDNIGKEDAKEIYDITEKVVKEFPDYNDYILDAGNVSDISIDSLGYLMKSLGAVKRTAGYMVLVMKEEVLQKFMLTNPEMFDFFAVFFNNKDALEFILSKR